MYKILSILAGTLAVVALAAVLSTSVEAAGGVKELRLKGNITSIDSSTGIVIVGTSYYSTGAFKLTAATRVKRNGVQCAYTLLKVGDFADASVDPYTREASRVEATGTP
jgi:hypothetical protein